MSLEMANHKSAEKRSRQRQKKNAINGKILTKIKTSLKNFESQLKDKKLEEINKSFGQINSSMAKALKKGLIKKQFVSRKLSSLSKKIKNI